MSASHDNGSHKSILGDVARHERALLATLEASREDARKIVERARGDATKHLSDQVASVQAEIAAERARAEKARLLAYDNAVAKAEESLRGRREKAMSRVQDMAKQVSEFFLPKGGHS